MPDEAQPKNCPVYIISLEHSHARREVISSRLAELNLPYEFRSGVDGRKLDLFEHPDYEPEKRRIFYGRDLSKGEFGCVLAHREIYRHMKENQIPRAVVLEDDAILTTELPAVIKALCRIPKTWDLVRFLGRPKNYRASRPIVSLQGTSCMLSRPHGTPGGAYGYVLNLHAAERLLSMMQRNWLAIDTLHGVTWLTGLKTLSVMPSPVLPNDDIPSCIDRLDNDVRWDKSLHLAGWRRSLYPLSRGMWKAYLNFNIKYVWISSCPVDIRTRRQHRKRSSHMGSDNPLNE